MTERQQDSGTEPAYGGDSPTIVDSSTAEEQRTEDVTVAEAGGEIRQASLWSDAWRQLRRSPTFLLGAGLFLIFAVMAVAPQLFTNADPRQVIDLGLSADPPTGDAWFGYDIQGRDYFANVVYGARVSMIVGFSSVLGVLLIGVTMGSLAGFYGGWIDSVLARITDVFYGLPLVLGAFLLLSVMQNRGIAQVSLALAIFGWMTAMRLVRGTVVSVKDADYVQAARALGASTWRILTRHILPNAVAPVLVYATITVGLFIAAEATLSFLGFGLQLPEIAWGLQISAGMGRLRDSAHLVFFPSIFLSLMVLSFILMGDALRDALDPKLR
ncbi:ABC transporter permease [Phytoactinopolyspora halotolerans]|uniref:ABC transporter permease n=1 Tax=Phytoactinopolyspora halotolerans TaxID=1981512 RepID=A0A6L9S748_9ACTN|nr:ABC transporter permease [Phytoactinopolyspora halotolerans]NEE01295.1 ABC transporter permease [Phytoactinopolyspora halotolerans]